MKKILSVLTSAALAATVFTGSAGAKPLLSEKALRTLTKLTQNAGCSFKNTGCTDCTDKGGKTCTEITLTLPELLKVLDGASEKDVRSILAELCAEGLPACPQTCPDTPGTEEEPEEEPEAVEVEEEEEGEEENESAAPEEETSEDAPEDEPSRRFTGLPLYELGVGKPVSWDELLQLFRGLPDVNEILPQKPAKPDTPDVPDTPAVPDTPSVPDTPAIPDKPSMPETPGVPEKPEAPTVPAEDVVTGEAGEYAEFVSEVVRLVNEERAKAGLAPVKAANAVLMKAAQKRAEEQTVLFSHTRPDGRSCFTVLSDYGISYLRAGENVAYGQRTPSEVMRGWMNSAGHRANILGADYDTLGVGCCKKNGTFYWAQMFIKAR